MVAITDEDLTEVMLRDKMQRLGLLDPITINGVAQPAVKVQLTAYNNKAIGLIESDRIVCIICNGRANTANSRFLDTPTFLIIVASKQDESDGINAKLIATAIEKELVDSYQDSCDIIGVTPSGLVGPMYDETGRVIYEINGSLSINRF